MSTALLTRCVALLALLGSTAQAAEIFGASDQNMAFEVKLGPHRPLISREVPTTPAVPPAAPVDPYTATFGNSDMLIGELELDYQFWHPFGSLAAGVGLGYAEKFGKAIDAATGAKASESTGIRLFPIKALVVYRFDWAAEKHNIPLVPYLKGGFVVEPWFVVKGGLVEEYDNRRAEGVKFGVAGTVGIALQLDFLDPRLARDFDTSAGVNHTYLFAEYSLTEVNNFGAKGLDLSSRNALFGLTVEF